MERIAGSVEEEGLAATPEEIIGALDSGQWHEKAPIAATEDKCASEVKAEERVLPERPPGRFSTRAYAIRSKCLDCCCGCSREVALCPLTGCPHWPWRSGNGTRAHRIVAQERIADIGANETHWAEKIADYTEQGYYLRQL